MSSHSDKKSKKDRTRNDKGILLEQVVAKLHNYEGVKVETNVRLRPISRDKRRRPREIDVLLTAKIADYPIRIAIQCKNYGHKVTLTDIAEFKDLLEDVGIPYQHGIIVSVRGYQSGALRRGKELGIRTLELEGLTHDRLDAEILDAFQFFVYLLPEVTILQINNNISPKNPLSGILSLSFFDKNEKFRGMVFDLIVNEWRRGAIPSRLGEYELNLKIPKNWHQLSPRRKVVKVFSITATIRIVAHVVVLKGLANRYVLKNAATKLAEKFHLNAEFSADSQLDSEILTTTYISEVELEDMLAEKEIKIVNRMRLPRILYDTLYHPLSKRVINVLFNRAKGLTNKQMLKLPKLTFDELEGQHSGAIHDEPLMGFPVLIENECGELVDLRMLFEEGRYSEILKFKDRAAEHPTDEFNGLIKAAQNKIGLQIIGQR